MADPFVKIQIWLGSVFIAVFTLGALVIPLTGSAQNTAPPADKTPRECFVCAAKDPRCAVLLKCKTKCDKSGKFRACKRECRSNRVACKHECEDVAPDQVDACFAKCRNGYTVCRKKCDLVKTDCHEQCKALPALADCKANCGACMWHIFR